MYFPFAPTGQIHFFLLENVVIYFQSPGEREIEDGILSSRGRFSGDLSRPMKRPLSYSPIGELGEMTRK
jgi:hypothetical protein